VTHPAALRCGPGQVPLNPHEARIRTDQSSITEAAWKITRRCRAKGKFCDKFYIQQNQGIDSLKTDMVGSLRREAGGVSSMIHGFLQDPRFLASTLDLQRPERILALLTVHDHVCAHRCGTLVAAGVLAGLWSRLPRVSVRCSSTERVSSGATG